MCQSKDLPNTYTVEAAPGVIAIPSVEGQKKEGTDWFI